MIDRTRSLGWRPSLPDKRDLFLRVPRVALPESVDLRDKQSPIRDQGDLGSCTAFAICALLEYQHLAQKLGTAVDFSELFLYYLERAREHTIDYDSGAYIRDGMKAARSTGVCTEQDWPYSTDNNRFMQKPSKKAYQDAKLDKTVTYLRVPQNSTSLKAELAQNYCFVFGFTVYDSFMTAEVARTGIAPMPDFSREKTVGGHAVCCVGYDDAKGIYLCRNSWGTSWGQAGYFTLPDAYVEDAQLCDDFWTVELV